MKLSLAAEGIDYNGTTVEQQREQRQNYITEHAFHFLKTKECPNCSFSGSFDFCQNWALWKEFLNDFIGDWKDLDPNMTQIAMEVYETNDFKRYGEKIHFFDNIKKPELLERINAMNYEGGIYSPYNALFYAAISALRSGEIFHQNAGAREHTGVSYWISLSWNLKMFF